MANDSNKSAGLSSKQRFKRRTCFLASSNQLGLRNLKMLLREKHIKVLTPTDLPLGGTSILKVVTKTISKAELFIAVLSSGEANTNVYFELGYAQALGKPTLVIVAPALKSLPTEILDIAYIRADLQNLEAVGFALDQLLAAFKPPLKQIHKARGEMLYKSSVDMQSAIALSQNRTHPIGKLDDNLLERVQLLKAQEPRPDRGAELQEIVLSALQASDVPVVVPSTEQGSGIDIAIWDDELELLVGNPFLIEIRWSFATEHEITTTLNQVSNYLTKTNSRWALVLYVQGSSTNRDALNSDFPTILLLNVDELLERLRYQSFGKIIQNLRNRLIHEGGI